MGGMGRVVVGWRAKQAENAAGELAALRKRAAAQYRKLSATEKAALPRGQLVLHGRTFVRGFDAERAKAVSAISLVSKGDKVASAQLRASQSKRAYERNRQYYLDYAKANRDRINERRRKAYRADPSARKRQNAAYRVRNAERVRDLDRARRERSAGERKAYNASYYRANKARANASSKLWRDANLDQVNERRRVLYAAKLSGDAPPPSRRMASRAKPRRQTWYVVPDGTGRR